MAAGVVFSHNDAELDKERQIIMAWTSGSDGSVTATTEDEYSGVLGKVVFVPDGGGTAPTAAYDITLKDKYGVDLLEGKGADLSATVSKYVSHSDGLGIPVKSKLTLAVANAGDSKGGKVYATIVT